METMYLTRQQVAKRWGCSVKTVERRITEYNIPIYPLGGKKLKLEDIERLEEQLKQFPEKEPVGT